ncbi:MAG TPA: DUF1579 family protein [Polyangia bacterium]|nr:DUF1579 family protein [Polyangia bacterium]
MKHFRTIGTSVALGALATLASVAVAQTPSAGPPPAPAAAMPPKAPAPAAKPAAAPTAAPTGAGAKATGATAPGTAAKAAPAPAAAAAAMPPPPAPKPAAELDQLKVFEGSWRCDGKQPAGPFGPEQQYKSTFKGKKDIDNFWIAIEYDQKKSKVHPMPIKARGFLGYDPAAKKYVTIGADNTGGWISESSPGWEGDKLVFSGDGSMGGQKVSFRETYTKKSEKEMTWSGEMKMGKDWISVGSDSCKK